MSKEHDILLNIHGHTHNGLGRTYIDQVMVLNPGSLKEGNFCILKLIKKDKWHVYSTEFINLINFWKKLS